VQRKTNTSTGREVFPWTSTNGRRACCGHRPQKITPRNLQGTHAKEVANSKDDLKIRPRVKGTRRLKRRKKKREWQRAQRQKNVKLVSDTTSDQLMAIGSLKEEEKESLSWGAGDEVGTKKEVGG